MKPCWKDYGLTEEGARLADEVLSEAQEIVSVVGPDIAFIVLKEARYRETVLPKMKPEFVRKYLKENKT